MGPSPGPEQVLRVQRREAGHVTSARVPSLIRKSRGLACGIPSRSTLKFLWPFSTFIKETLSLFNFNFYTYSLT